MYTFDVFYDLINYCDAKLQHEYNTKVQSVYDQTTNGVLIDRLYPRRQESQPSQVLLSACPLLRVETLVTLFRSHSIVRATEHLIVTAKNRGTLLWQAKDSGSSN